MTSAEQRMERAIIKTIIEDALEMGYTVSHNDGESMTTSARVDDLTTKEDAVSKLLKEIQACDEEYLYFHKNGRAIGFVLLVYGNDGYDVVADHTDSVEIDEILKGANELADSFAY